MPSDPSRFLQPPPPDGRGEPKISRSPGLVDWMLAQRLSLAYTSYHRGGLIVAGVAPDGRVAFDEQYYARAMGVHYRDRILHVASLFQIWSLRNMLEAGEYANRAYDCVLVPRQAYTTGYVDTHELAVDAGGRILFVSSRFSCLATVDDRLSFRALWKPPFISALAAEDRCHLNGLAMDGAVARYVTAMAASDRPAGWRDAPDSGGVLIDIAANSIVAEGLSMPHSPRVHDGAVWLLESGRGYLVRIDPATGVRSDVVFCPGFLRGMTIWNGFAIVGVSTLRSDSFPLGHLRQELAACGEESWCGLLMIDLARAAIVEFIRYEAGLAEVFDVAVLPGIRNPLMIGPATEEILGTVRFADDIAPPR